jgi:hypothetical protein
MIMSDHRTLWCNDCQRWSPATYAVAVDVWRCDACGDRILCDECGAELNSNPPCCPRSEQHTQGDTLAEGTESE